MSYACVKVLACVSEVMEELAGLADKEAADNFAEECWESDLIYNHAFEKMYGYVTDGIQECYGDIVDCAELTGKVTRKPDKAEFLPGFLYSDELLAEAEKWNGEIESEVLAVINDISEGAKECGSLPGLLQVIANHSGHVNMKDSKNITYRLRHAASDLDGAFVYGGTRLVLDVDDSFYGWDPDTSLRQACGVQGGGFSRRQVVLAAVEMCFGTVRSGLLPLSF